MSVFGLENDRQQGESDRQSFMGCDDVAAERARYLGDDDMRIVQQEAEDQTGSG
jgi:hypothetical protein